MAAKKRKASSRTSAMSMRPVRLGRRSSGGAKASKGRKDSSATKEKTKETKEKKATKPAAPTRSPAAARSRAAAGGTTKKAPAPNMQERMEGLQGWMAEIERKQNRMTRFGGAGVIVAILAAGGALALGILNMQDAATESDLDDLREQVNGLSGEIEQQTETQLGTLNKNIKDLQTQVQSLQQQQQQNAQTISRLQNQVNSARSISPTPPTPVPAPDATP